MSKNEGSRRDLRGLIHNGGIGALAFSDDGRLLASGSIEDQQVKVWDVQSGRPLRAFTGYAGEIFGLTFRPDGRCLALASSGTIRLFDVETGDELRTMDHNGQVRALAFSPDGRKLASGSGNAVKLWDAETGKETGALSWKNTVTTIAFSPDSQLLAVGTASGTVSLADIAEFSKTGPCVDCGTTPRFSNASPTPSTSTSAAPVFGILGPILESTTGGVKIVDVLPGSPAARAGVQAGDDLIEFGGQTITDFSSYSRLLQQKRPGDNVTIKILRRGQTIQIDVTLTGLK